MKQLLKGNFPENPAAEVNQRGGNALIDESRKRIPYQVGTGPADRLSIQSLIDAVSGSRSHKAHDGVDQ